MFTAATSKGEKATSKSSGAAAALPTSTTGERGELEGVAERHWSAPQVLPSVLHGLLSPLRRDELVAGAPVQDRVAIDHHWSAPQVPPSALHGLGLRLERLNAMQGNSAGGSPGARADDDAAALSHSLHGARATAGAPVRPPLDALPHQLLAPVGTRGATRVLRAARGGASAAGESPGLPAFAGLTVSRPGDADEIAADDRARSVLAATPGVSGQPSASGPEGASLAASFSGAGAGGAGAPLLPGVRRLFEPRFGRDLGAVRVHADSAAASAADRLAARAFTVGQDIFFGAGELRPGDPAGLKLLAHELAHTEQADGHPRIRRQERPAAAPGSATAGGLAAMSDAELTRILEASPSLSGGFVVPQLGGLRAMGVSHPSALAVMRARMSQRYGADAFEGIRANEDRVLPLVRKSQELHDRITLLLGELSVDEHEAAIRTIEYRRDRVGIYTYDEAMRVYARFGVASIEFWELILSASVDTILDELQQTASDAQAEADAREAERARQREAGRGGVGRVVASRERLFWFDDTVTTTDVLAPEEGAEELDDALARARIAGVACAVLRVERRYYVYRLSHDFTYGDVWEGSQFEGRRSRLVTGDGSGASAVLTRDGFVLRREPLGGGLSGLGERYFGRDRERRSRDYLASDERLLEAQGENLSSAEALRLFQQMTLDRVLVNLQDAESRLTAQISRLFGDDIPVMLNLRPEAGAALQRDASALRSRMLYVARLTERIGDRAPTDEQREDMAAALEEIGRILTENPTAGLMVRSEREPDDRSPVRSDQFTNRVAGERPGDAARIAAQELHQRLENVRRIRVYLQGNPEAAYGLKPVHAPILARFPATQRMYIELRVALHELGEIASAIGIAAAELGLAILGFFTAGTALGIAVATAGTTIGLSQTVEQVESASRLTAMSALDLPGGVQLVSPAQAASARRWAYIGVALTALDVGAFLHGATQLSRVRAVLEHPELGRLLASTERTLAEVAADMGISERALLHQLENATGAERAVLLDRIHRLAVIRGAAEGPVLTALAEGVERVLVCGVAYRRNPVSRGVNEVADVARRAGVDLLDDLDIRILFSVDPSLPANVGATYGKFRPRTVRNRQVVSWMGEGGIASERMVDASGRLRPIPRTGAPPDADVVEVVSVRLRPEVLHSDEAIAGYIAHETHELRGLYNRFAAAGGELEAIGVARLIDPNLAGRAVLHEEAWDVASRIVNQMRGGATPPPTP
ncbi:eCIS core domain-containing protein [Sorangium sp. So ce1182]|uniref:eCIS core domain-containing protein n=1 Tax=Sorangium sp. So ce1182 TaxID=3133334 RepID=UPI003F63FA6C